MTALKPALDGIRIIEIGSMVAVEVIAQLDGAQASAIEEKSGAAGTTADADETGPIGHSPRVRRLNWRCC